MTLLIWFILLYITGLWAVIDMILSGVLPILDYEVYIHHSKKSLFIPRILAFLIFIMPFIFHLTNWATIFNIALDKVKSANRESDNTYKKGGNTEEFIASYALEDDED